jgi:ABC-type nitrate/sulfonate/bicarbonate transport system substrate-binding protein
MKTRRIFCLVLMVVFVFAAFTEGAAKSTVNFNITFSTWVGYGPLFIARKKGSLKNTASTRNS